LRQSEGECEGSGDGSRVQSWLIGESAECEEVGMTTYHHNDLGQRIGEFHIEGKVVGSDMRVLGMCWRKVSEMYEESKIKDEEGKVQRCVDNGRGREQQKRDLEVKKRKRRKRKSKDGHIHRIYI
jgi:hypothetical protein